MFYIFITCRRPKEKKEQAVEPEVDPERDQRTVFAYQVAKLLLEYYCVEILY